MTSGGRGAGTRSRRWRDAVGSGPSALGPARVGRGVEAQDARAGGLLGALELMEGTGEARSQRGGTCHLGWENRSGPLSFYDFRTL